MDSKDECLRIECRCFVCEYSSRNKDDIPDSEVKIH